MNTIHWIYIWCSPNFTSETFPPFYCPFLCIHIHKQNTHTQSSAASKLKGIIWQVHTVERVASARVLVILPSEVCWIIMVSLTPVKLSFSSDLCQAALSLPLFHLFLVSFYASSHTLISLYPAIHPLPVLLHSSAPDLNLIICFNSSSSVWKDLAVKLIHSIFIVPVMRINLKIPYKL